MTHTALSYECLYDSWLGDGRAAPCGSCLIGPARFLIRRDGPVPGSTTKSERCEVADSPTDQADGVEENAPTADEAEDKDSPTDKVKEKVVDAATSDDEGLIAPLKKVAVTAAVAALTPVVKNAAEGAANKLPEMLENAGGPEGLANLAKDKLGEAGGMGGVAKLVTDQIGGGGGGGIVSSALGAVTGGALGGGDDSEASKPPDGAGSGRRMPIQQ